jgi:hypothetical protein
VNGTIDRWTFTASYSIESDCTGKAVMTVAHGATVTLQFIVELDGTQIDLMVAGADGPGQQVETGRATKQFVHTSH